MSDYNWDDIAKTTLQTYGLILDEAAENNWGRNASLYYEDYMPYDGHEPISSHLRYGEAGPYWETASENLPGALEKRRPNSQ
jgi:hypothetical protein